MKCLFDRKSRRGCEDWEKTGEKKRPWPGASGPDLCEGKEGVKSTLGKSNKEK